MSSFKGKVAVITGGAHGIDAQYAWWRCSIPHGIVNYRKLTGCIR